MKGPYGWLSEAEGRALCRLSGAFPAAFLNRCAAAGIRLDAVEAESDTALRFTLPVRALARAQKLALRCQCELTPLRLWSCHVQLNKGDALFLCTDGVWEALAHSELKAAFRTARPEIALHEALRGVFCDDNVTFIVLRD